MKPFEEALHDGFSHITEVTDIKELQKFRTEGILVDEEGYYSFVFGDNKEYELCLEPILDEGNYLVALYKHRVLLTHKLPVRVLPLRE